MTITLILETETRLRQKAEREGQDINAVADTLLLMWKPGITTLKI